MNRRALSLSALVSASLASPSAFAQSAVEVPPLYITPVDTQRIGPPLYIPSVEAPRMGPPPTLPTPQAIAADTTVELVAMPVPFTYRAAARGRSALIEDDTRFQEQRWLRLFVATMASVGATVIGGSLTTATYSLAYALVPCGLFCVTASPFLAAGFVGLATSFAQAGAFTFAATQFSARGSYWAAFGGWWAGAATAALFTAIASASPGSQLFAPVAATTFSLLPLVGQAIVFELTARAPLVDNPQRAVRTEAARPAIAIARDGLPTFSLSGQF